MNTNRSGWKKSLRMSALGLALTAGMFSTACSRDGSEANFDSCDETRTTLTRDEVSSLGFSAGQLLDSMSNALEVPFLWTSGSQTTLHLQVAYSDGIINFVDAEPKPSEEGTYTDGAAAICDDYVEVGVTLSFKTDDGAFDESFDLKLQSFDGLSATFGVDLLPDSLNGSYELTIENPEQYDEVTAYLNGSISGTSSAGKLYEQGSKVDGETASATAYDAATWGPLPD